MFTLLTPSEVDIASFFMFFSKVHLYKITGENPGFAFYSDSISNWFLVGPKTTWEVE